MTICVDIFGCVLDNAGISSIEFKGYSNFEVYVGGSSAATNKSTFELK